MTAAICSLTRIDLGLFFDLAVLIKVTCKDGSLLCHLFLASLYPVGVHIKLVKGDSREKGILK